MGRHSRAVGRVVVGLAFVAGLLFVVPGSVRLFNGIHEAYALPARITVCDRDYRKDASDRRRSWAKISADTTPGFQPVVVDPSLLAQVLSPCQVGACTRIAQDGPCATVVWVRVDWDAYVAYSLVGGP